MIAVLIIGIMGLAALPKISDVLADRRLASACTLVAAGLEYAAALSIRHQRPFTLSTDDGLNRIRVTDTAPYPDTTASVRTGNIPPVNADNVVFNKATGQWYSLIIDDIPDMKGIRISSAASDITFYPDGHSSGTDSLIILSLGNLSSTVRVDGISGRVSVE